MFENAYNYISENNNVSIYHFELVNLKDVHQKIFYQIIKKVLGYQKKMFHKQ